jgi:hypothetical protein
MMKAVIEGVGERVPEPRKALAPPVQQVADAVVACAAFTGAAAQHPVAEILVGLQVGQRPVESPGAFAPRQQALGPGGHHLGQRHQARGVPGRGGVEHQQVVILEPLRDGVGDALEQRRFLHAGRLARQRHVAVDLACEVLGHQPAQRRADLGEVFLDDPVGIELHAVQVGREAHRPRPDRAVPEMPEVVGRVGGNHQHPAPGLGLRQRRAGCDGGLADTALAAEEQYTALPGEAQQHRRWSSGECSMPMRRCQS